jgi:hypothetical protein
LQVNELAKKYIRLLEERPDAHPLALLGEVTGRFTASSVLYDVSSEDRTQAIIDLDMLRNGCPIFERVYWRPANTGASISNKELAQKLKDFMTKEAGLVLSYD